MANDGNSQTGMTKWLSSLPTWAWSAVAGLVALLILVALAWSLTGTDDASSLALLVLGGLVVLILALAGLVALFHSLNLIDRNQAFGLPDGTIRALLALSLLVVFVGLATFLFGNLSSPQGAAGLQPVGEPFSVPAAQFDAVLQRIPEQLVVLPSLSEDGERYSVQVFATYEGSSATSEDLAGQIFTAVSTILVTVIGFYFGSRTTAAGAGGATQATPAERAAAATAAAQKSATDAAAAAESATAAAASVVEAASKPDASNAVREQAAAVQRAADEAKAASAAADEAASEAKRLAAEAAAATDDASRENAASSALLARARAQEAARKALDRAQQAEDAKKKLDDITT